MGSERILKVFFYPSVANLVIWGEKSSLNPSSIFLSSSDHHSTITHPISLITYILLPLLRGQGMGGPIGWMKERHRNGWGWSAHFECVFRAQQTYAEAGVR